VPAGSEVIVIPKPIYGYPVTRILNGDTSIPKLSSSEGVKDLNLEGVRALIVDDEPMNLVVASGLFREYKMIIDTAESGKEAIYKYDVGDYDVIFMDHMMPEMDGVEAMKKIRYVADQKGKRVKVIALTANAISGAREMFLREGFDGFISKPIVISDFEKVMSRVMSDSRGSNSGGVR
jgi:CheY-like chemotaxis protein